jgi:ribosomal-protein-alanine N-acetyltransferase
VTIEIRPLTVDDCTERYAGWLNDPAVNQYLECRFQEHTAWSLGEWLQNLPSTSRIFAIIHDGAHVGNVKLGNMNDFHGTADIGYFIGERSLWGKGIATDAVKLAVDAAFYQFGLKRLIAGVYQSNQPSIRVLQNAGFLYEASWRQWLRGPHGQEDQCWYARIRDARIESPL